MLWLGRTREHTLGLASPVEPASVLGIPWVAYVVHLQIKCPNTNKVTLLLRTHYVYLTDFLLFSWYVLLHVFTIEMTP